MSILLTLYLEATTVSGSVLKRLLNTWLLPNEVRDSNTFFVFGRLLDCKEQKRFRLPCRERDREGGSGEKGKLNVNIPSPVLQSLSQSLEYS